MVNIVWRTKQTLRSTEQSFSVGSAADVFYQSFIFWGLKFGTEKLILKLVMHAMKKILNFKKITLVKF